MKNLTKHLTRLVYLAMTVIIPLQAGAYDFMVDGLAYNIKSSDAVSVTRADYSGLTAANIPSNVTYNGQTYSVTSIEESAFWQCGDLTSVTIPNTVKSIGEGAFYYCFGLNRVNISDLAAWCSICFYGDEYYGKNGNPLCYAGNLYIDGTLVNDLVIPSTVSVINKSAFSGCRCITSVTIPNSVVTIDERAFYSSSLTTVTIPESVTSIGKEAFSYCSGLSSLNIPKSITSIGGDAFKGCANLTIVNWNPISCSIEFGTSLCPFYDSYNINSFIFGNSVEIIPPYICQELTGLTSVIIPNSVTSIGERAFMCCSGLTSVTIPNSVTSINDAFFGCTNLTSVTLNNNSIVSNTSDGYGVSGIFGNQVENYILGNSVTSIGDYAFSGCDAMISLTIPNSVISIGNYAFQSCTGLTSVTLPNSVSLIGDYSFFDCIGLSSVAIPNSVLTIGEGAFWGCSGLNSLSLGYSISSIGDYAFMDCNNLDSVAIPSSVTSIGGGAFLGCDGLISVTLDCNSIVSNTSNGSGFSVLFGNKVENYILGNSVTSIGDYAFSDCDGMISATIPNSVSSIGEGAFYGCANLCSVIIPNQVTLIRDWTFFGCNGMSSVVLPKSLSAIGNSAFSGCGLTSITIGDSVTSIGEGAFYNCIGLVSMTLGSSVTSIGNFAFNGCINLTSVIIPKKVVEIGECAFSQCKGLSTIIVEDNNIRYDSRNNCNAIIETETNSLIFGCKNTIIPVSVNDIRDYAFSGCNSLTRMILPNSLTSIGNYAFEDCSCLNSLTLTGNGSWTFNSSQFVGLNHIINQIKTLNVGSEITSLGNFNFAPDVINSYAVTPPTCLSGTFSNYDGELHVPVVSTAAYFLADYWQNFDNLINDLSERVLLNIEEANIVKGGTMALSAATSPESCNIVWSSSNPKVAIVDDEGVVTAIEEGECYIFATLESSPAIYASCHITSSYPEISLSLNTDFLNMRFGEEAILVATIMPDNLGLIPTWTSSDTSVATVDNGVVTAVGEGECDITVTVLDKAATCHVIVNSDVVITLSKDNDIIGVNQILTIYPTCSPDVPVDFDVTSSDPSVVMVRLINRSNAPSVGILNFTEKGQAIIHANMLTSASSKSPAYANEKAIMIVGVSYGSATITVGSVDGNAIPATLELRVVDVDGDGTVTAADITALYDYLLNGDQSHITTSDVDGDGAITSADITAVYNILLGND